jgi:hypothetical protein
MCSPNQRQSHTFIVRLWQEDANSGWRGQVEHVRSKQQYYFTTLADLNAFMQNQLKRSTDKEMGNNDIT